MSTATPDTATPDTATPDTATPDTATPDTATPGTATPDTPAPGTTVRVCALDDLVPERGTGALVGEHRVALFRLATDEVLAVQQRDPYSGANVLSRGLVGDREGEPTVTSPMYKQVWDLRTGACLDPVGKDPVDLRVHTVVVVAGEVLVVV